MKTRFALVVMADGRIMGCPETPYYLHPKNPMEDERYVVTSDDAGCFDPRDLDRAIQVSEDARREARKGKP